MPRIPIACTLTVEDAGDRVDEWRQFFASHSESVDRRSTTEAVVRLNRGDAALLAAADLALREKACCEFFDFTIALRPDGRWLEVRVPDEAATVLADFIGLASQA